MAESTVIYIETFNSVKNNYKCWEKRETGKLIIYKVIRLITFLLPLKTLQNELTQIMLRYDHQETTRVVTFGGSYGYQKESIERAWWRRMSNCPLKIIFFLFQVNMKSIYVSFMEIICNCLLKINGEIGIIFRKLILESISR